MWNDDVADMMKTCAPVCTSCDFLTLQKRCPLDPNAVDVWQPGDLNKMFEKLTSEPYKSKYEVEILSSPKTDAPWVITMENVISAEEAIRLIELGYQLGFEQSTEVGTLQSDGSYSEEKSEARCVRDAVFLFCIMNAFALSNVASQSTIHL
jgi:prolyl 4-hydroxylase